MDLKSSLYETEMFTRSIMALIVMYLGASNTYAELVNKDPDSIMYFNWVKDAILYTLLPRFETMVNIKNTVS